MYYLDKIITVDEVVDFAHFLLEVDSVNFHPDTGFEDYINLEKHEPTYTPDEVKAYNALMEQCFDVCEEAKVDIYEVMYV